MKSAYFNTVWGEEDFNGMVPHRTNWEDTIWTEKWGNFKLKFYKFVQEGYFYSSRILFPIPEDMHSTLFSISRVGGKGRLLVYKNAKGLFVTILSNSKNPISLQSFGHINNNIGHPVLQWIDFLLVLSALNGGTSLFHSNFLLKILTSITQVFWLLFLRLLLNL